MIVNLFTRNEYFVHHHHSIGDPNFVSTLIKSRDQLNDFLNRRHLMFNVLTLFLIDLL